MMIIKPRQIHSFKPQQNIHKHDDNQTTTKHSLKHKHDDNQTTTKHSLKHKHDDNQTIKTKHDDSNHNKTFIKTQT